LAFKIQPQLAYHWKQDALLPKHLDRRISKQMWAPVAHRVRLRSDRQVQVETDRKS